jgi:hypothetical protein
MPEQAIEAATDVVEISPSLLTPYFLGAFCASISGYSSYYSCFFEKFDLHGNKRNMLIILWR